MIDNNKGDEGQWEATHGNLKISMSNALMNKYKKIINIASRHLHAGSHYAHAKKTGGVA